MLKALYDCYWLRHKRTGFFHDSNKNCVHIVDGDFGEHISNYILCDLSFYHNEDIESVKNTSYIGPQNAVDSLNPKRMMFEKI